MTGTLGVNNRSDNNRMNDRGGCGRNERSQNLLDDRGDCGMIDDRRVGRLTGSSKNGGSGEVGNSARLIQSRSVTRWVGNRSADLLIEDRSGDRLVRNRRDSRAGNNDRVGGSGSHGRGNTGRSALGI